MFARTQEAFAAALLDAEQPFPPALAPQRGARADKRFAVYRNNVVMGLVRALETRFPATRNVVGEEFFAAMARVFVTRRPPRSPLLMFYGDDLADFIAGFEPAADIPYLADVARIEAARTRAYHAADATAIDPARLQSVTPDALAQMRVKLHPSAEIVRSVHPVVTIWAMNSGEIEPAPIGDWRPQDALVLRAGLDVEVRELRAGGAAFLRTLAQGQPLGVAAQITAGAEKGFDLVANLAGLIGSGLVTEVTFEPAQVPS
jgi:hypothetical protein